MISRKLLVVGALLLLAATLALPILIHPGPILYLDFFLPIYPRNFVSYYYPMWNELASSSTVESTSRLAARLPFVFMALAGMPVAVIEKLMYWTLYFVGLCSGYYCSRRLFGLSPVVSILCSLTFTTSVTISDYLYQYATPWAALVFPAEFTLVHMGLSKRRLSYLLIAGLLLLTAAQYPLTFLISNLFIAILWFIHFILGEAHARIWLIWGGVVFITSQLLLGAYYLIPMALTRPTAESLAHYISNIDVARFLSPETDLQPLLLLRSSVQMVDYWYDSPLLHGVQYWTGVVLFVFLFPIAMMLSCRDKQWNVKQRALYLSASGFFIILWGFSQGTRGPFFQLLKPLLFVEIGGMFRSAYKWYLFFPGVYLIATGVLIVQSRTWPICLRVVWVSFLIGGSLFYNMPAFLRSGRILTAAIVPGEFDRVNQFLLQRYIQEGAFKVLWYPPYMERATIWAPDSKISRFDMRSSRVPTYSYAWNSNYTEFAFVHYLRELFARNAMKEVAAWLRRLGVRYVVFHADRLGTYQGRDLRREDLLFLDRLQSSQEFEQVYHDNFMYVFEIRSTQQFQAVQNLSPVIIGNFDVLASVLFADENADTGYIINDARLPPDGRGQYPEITDGGEDLLIQEILRLAVDEPDTVLIRPSQFTDRRAVKEAWSIASGFDLPWGEWHTLLDLHGLDNWDLDYGAGLAVTMARQTRLTLTMPIEIKTPGQYIILLRLFYSPSGRSLGIWIDGHQLEVIDISSFQSHFKWQEYDYYFGNSGEHSLTIEHHDGLSAVNLILVIPAERYQEYRTTAAQVLDTRPVIYALEAEQDCQLFGPARESNRDTPKSGGHDVSLLPGQKLTCGFRLYASGEYYIAIRGSGHYRLQVGLDSEQLDLPGYSFHTVGPYTLSVGSQSLELFAQSASVQDGIDVIWLFPAAAGESLQTALVRTPSSASISYSHPRTELYEFSGQTPDRPLIALRESYNSGWVLRSDNGQSVTSLPLYGVINGYLLSDTEGRHGTIEFLPQKGLNYGLGVSTMALIVVTMYLSWTCFTRSQDSIDKRAPNPKPWRY